MVDLGAELGAQSYCFRNFKENTEVIRLLKQAGLARTELCGVHVNFALQDRFDEIISLYKRSGVGIVSIGVLRFAGEEKMETKYFEFAKRAGAKAISADFAIGSTPRSLKTAEKLADKYDVNLAIHNHGGRHWLGCAECLRHIFATSSPRIGLCLDTAWALDSGEDPVAMAEQFAGRLYGLHIKDFVFDRARKPEDVVVGTGNLDLRRLLHTLQEIDFKGFAVLEYEGSPEDPAPAVRSCAEAVRKLM